MRCRHLAVVRVGAAGADLDLDGCAAIECPGADRLGHTQGHPARDGRVSDRDV